MVAGAGGAGIVIVNNGADGIHNDFLALPAVHLSHTVRDELRAYVSTPGAMARLPPADLRDDTAAPEIAEYSARGPAQSSDGTPVAQGYLLKPGDYDTSCQGPVLFCCCKHAQAVAAEAVGWYLFPYDLMTLLDVKECKTHRDALQEPNCSSACLSGAGWWLQGKMLLLQCNAAAL